ncbi:MAG: alkaline phosphatase D family protein [Piscinibacter sp.]
MTIDDGWQRGGRRGLTDLRFVWGGDTAGQGWGINPAFGGMKIYESMRQRAPRFFIHSGDTIYADGPILPTATAEGGQPVAEHRHARGQQGGRDAGRVPRPLPLQPDRRQRAPL